jgi:hypothetical protein
MIKQVLYQIRLMKPLKLITDMFNKDFKSTFDITKKIDWITSCIKIMNVNLAQQQLAFLVIKTFMYKGCIITRGTLL